MIFKTPRKVFSEQEVFFYLLLTFLREEKLLSELENIASKPRANSQQSLAKRLDQDYEFVQELIYAIYDCIFYHGENAIWNYYPNTGRSIHLHIESFPYLLASSQDADIIEILEKLHYWDKTEAKKASTALRNLAKAICSVSFSKKPPIQSVLVRAGKDSSNATFVALHILYVDGDLRPEVFDWLKKELKEKNLIDWNEVAKLSPMEAQIHTVENLQKALSEGVYGDRNRSVTVLPFG